MIAALDAADAEARTQAAAALEAAPERDRLVADWLRDPARRGKLGDGALAALCRAAAAHDVRAANPGLRAILRDSAAGADAKRAAATALAKTGGVADVSALADAIEAVPKEASEALAAIGGPSAVSALVRGGGENPAPEVLAARSRLGDSAAFDALIERLASGPADGATRVQAALSWAAGRDLGSDPAAWRRHARREQMVRRLADADNDAAQTETARLADAVRAGDPEILDDLAVVVADTAAPVYARAKAAIAIGLSGQRSKNDVLLAATANQIPGDVRRAAAQALARVGDLSCAVPIANMLVHDEDRDRLLAKRVPRTEFVPVDPELARCLSRRGLPGGGFAMIDILQGEYRTGLQRDAMRAFEELTGGRHAGYEPDASQKERMEACYRLRNLWRDVRDELPLVVPADDPGWPKFRADVNVLIDTLKAQRFLIQWRAKRALIIVAEPAADQLVAALSHDVMHIRMGAAEVMAEAALRRFTVPLAERLSKDTNAVARTKYLAALETCARPDAKGEIPGGDATRAPVRAALGDRASIDVRIAAVRALGVVGDASDVARIVAARAESRNAEETFRAASALALLRRGDRSGLPDFVVELRCDDVARRTDAVRGLAALGVEVAGYDPDASPEARESAVAAFEKLVPPGTQR